MLAARQRAVSRFLRGARRYSSQSHGSGHGTESGNEPIGRGFWGAVAAVPFAVALYQFSRPNTVTGEPPALTQWLMRFWHLSERWAERNALHAAALEQAGHDRLLLFTAPREESYDLRFPEAFHSHGRRSISAGSQINLDRVMEHYRTQHIQEEERKMQKLAAASAASESS